MEQEKTPRERAGDLISLLVSDWRPTPRQSLGAIRIAIILGVLVAIGYAYDITLWDWAKLLIVPAAIAGAGIWFNAQQSDRERKRANEHARGEALQTYLDQMGRLLLDEDKQLGKSIEGDEVRTLARAWTITALTRLGSDGVRKRSVVQFLFEAKLITRDHIAINLREAFLNFVNLNGANLTGVNLHGVSLTKAMMNSTELGQADLSDTRMFGANLLLANLCGADMSGAVLMSGNTDSIPLPRASATGNYFFDSPGPKNANLRLADLSEVDLTDAYVSEEQLLSAASLEGATMPNGQKYEDWLKDKGGWDRNTDRAYWFTTNFVESRLAELRVLRLHGSSHRPMSRRRALIDSQTSVICQRGLPSPAPPVAYRPLPPPPAPGLLQSHEDGF